MAKIAIFTDPHCGPDKINCGCRYPSDGLRRISDVILSAKTAGASLLLCLGDLADGNRGSEDAADYLSRAASLLTHGGLPFVCIPGNHDLYAVTYGEYLSHTRWEQHPFSLRADDTELIFLDACFADNGTPEGVRYFSDRIKTDWKNSYVPQSQLRRLESTLRASDARQFWIFSHSSLDASCEKSHIIRNADKIREILDREGKGRVRRCVSGHYHAGCETVTDGRIYTTLKALCVGDPPAPDTLLILNTEENQ